MPTRPISASVQFSAFLSRFPAEIVSLARRCLIKLRGAFPGCNELVYDYSNSLVVSFSMSEHGYQGIVAIAILPREVRLYFDKSLPDPQGLLSGTGSKVRSVTVSDASELDGGDIHDLIQAAIKQSKKSRVTFPQTGKTRMVIKSGSTDKASRQAPKKQPKARDSAKRISRKIKSRQR